VQELALRQEELRIKDARMGRLPAQRRPHYPPIERLAILHPSPVVEEEAFTEALRALDPGPSARASAEPRTGDSLSGIEEEHIRRVLQATHGNKSRAAEILGIERKTLYRKLERMRESEPRP